MSNYLISIDLITIATLVSSIFVFIFIATSALFLDLLLAFSIRSGYWASNGLVGVLIVGSG